MMILTVVVALTFLGTGAAKLAGLRQSLEIRDHLQLSPPAWRAIGALEVAGAVGALAGLAWDPIGVAALVGLTLLMVGALVSRIRAHDGPLWLVIDAATLALVAVTLLSTR